MTDQDKHDQHGKAIERQAGRLVLAAAAGLDDVALTLCQASFVIPDNKKARRLASLSRAASLAGEPLRKLAGDLIRARRRGVQ